MCPGVDSASKNEFQETPGGKGGRCVTVTTLPPSQCGKSRKSGALTYRIPKGLSRPVAGKLYLFTFLSSTIRFLKEHCFWKIPSLVPSVLVWATCRGRCVWSTGGMILTGRNQSTWKVTCASGLTCSSSTLSTTVLKWTNRAFVVRGRWVTAWEKERPRSTNFKNQKLEHSLKCLH